MSLSSRNGTSPISGIGMGSVLLMVVVTLVFTDRKPVMTSMPTAKMPKALGDDLEPVVSHRPAPRFPARTGGAFHLETREPRQWFQRGEFGRENR